MLTRSILIFPSVNKITLLKKIIPLLPCTIHHLACLLSSRFIPTLKHCNISWLVTKLLQLIQSRLSRCSECTEMLLVCYWESPAHSVLHFGFHRVHLRKKPFQCRHCEKRQRKQGHIFKTQLPTAVLVVHNFGTELFCLTVTLCFPLLEVNCLILYIQGPKITCVHFQHGYFD